MQASHGLNCPVCFAVYSWTSGSYRHRPSPYSITSTASIDATIIRPQSKSGVQPRTGGDGSRVMARYSDDNNDVALQEAFRPRQLPQCGHVTCTACIVMSYVDALDEAAYREAEESGMPSSFTKPARLTETQLQAFASMIDERITSIRCPILTCNTASPCTRVIDYPAMTHIAKRAATTRLQWELHDTEPVAVEWKEPVIDNSEELAAAALVTCTDCFAFLRGDCHRKPTEPCKYRHPNSIAVNSGTLCRTWIKTGTCSVDCKQLHPSPGLIARTDCLSASHPRLFCNGRWFGKPCPFRHVDPLGRFIAPPPVCSKWADYACGDITCEFAHPYEKAPPSHTSTRARIRKKGYVGVFWDMISCQIPDGGWPYGVAMAFDRLLRKAGYFTTGPGWTLHFRAFGGDITPELRSQLATARATAVDSGPDPDEDATLSVVASKAINHGVSVMLDDEMMNFARKAKANHIGCIVVASASKRLIANIQRLTLKGVHIVVVVPDPEKVSEELLNAASEALSWSDVTVLAHTSPPEDLMRKAALMNTNKQTFAPKEDGPPHCPQFKPALQMGCPSGDACVYFHEKRPCRSLLMAVADCPFGNDCLFRHVPMATTQAKLASKEMSIGLRGLPNFQSAVTWGKKGVRKMYCVPKHDGSKHSGISSSDSPTFRAPPGYWTCSMCMFKFNPPLPVQDTFSTAGTKAFTALTGTAPVPITDPQDTPCTHCGATFRDAGVLPSKQPKNKITAKGCWYCNVCFFGGNTIGKDFNCQICSSPGGNRANGLTKLWICDSCEYWNDDVPTLRNCDFCQAEKPGDWAIRYADTSSGDADNDDAQSVSTTTTSVTTTKK